MASAAKPEAGAEESAGVIEQDDGQPELFIQKRPIHQAYDELEVCGFQV